MQLPGREERLREPVPTDLAVLADEIVGRIDPLTQTPYALYGHSMGALLAFEIVRRLESVGRPAPTLAFLAGYGAPHLFRSRNRLHTLRHDELIAELRRTRAIPAPVLDEPELMGLLAPILRADLAMCAAYVSRPVDEITVSAGISAFAGADDPEVPVAAVAAWAEVTSGPFRLRVLPGGHFFVADAQALLLEAIGDDLARAL